MLEELREQLQEQIEEFDRELRIELPKRIAAAVELGDLSENAEYSSALERQEFVRARLGQLTKRQGELSRIDLRDVPRDVAAFGSKIEGIDEDGERHEWQIVFPEFVHLDDRMISIASPLGRALVGARPGQDVEIETPDGERTFRIVVVETLHGDVLTEAEEE